MTSPYPANPVSSEIYLHTQNTGGVWVIAKEQSTGNVVPGMFFGLYNSNNQLVQTGFTPKYIPISSTGTYTINYNNYGSYYFTRSPTTSNFYDYNWGGTATAALYSTTDVHIDGTYYNNNNSGANSRVEFRSQGPSSALSMFIAIQDGSGNTLARGYGPFTVGVPTNQPLTVIWNNWGGHNIYGRSFNTAEDSFQIAPPPNQWGATQVIRTSSFGGNAGYYDQGNFS